MARPSKLNEELIEQFAEKLRKGLNIQTVCDLLMITQPSYNNWMRQGEDDITNGNEDSLFAAFFLEIKKARAEFEELANERISEGAPGWQGMAWWLERTRAQYMPKQEISAGEDGKVQVILGGKLKEIKKGNLTKDGEIK